MFTDSQLSEIRNYLLSKKLPIDILIEVNDHFVSQISDLQREENLSFEEAFEKVKDDWKEELTLSWNGSIDLSDTNPFIRDVRQQLAIENLISASKYTILTISLIIISALIFNKNIFKYFCLLTFLSFSIFPLFVYIKNFKKFQLARKYSNYILTLHQGGSFLFLGILGLSLQFTAKFFDYSDEVQKLIHSGKTNFEITQILLLIIGTLTLTLISFFSIISQTKYIKQIEKVKPFLKYL